MQVNLEQNSSFSPIIFSEIWASEQNVVARENSASTPDVPYRSRLLFYFPLGSSSFHTPEVD